MTQWSLESIFNPGKRHDEEEKRRLQATRQEEGDGAKGKRINFDEKKITITTKNKNTSQHKNQVK